MQINAVTDALRMVWLRRHPTPGLNLSRRQGHPTFDEQVAQSEIVSLHRRVVSSPSPWMSAIRH